MAFQINTLQTFITFVESKNIFEAANKLQISQPSVTVHLRYLEDWFKTPLFTLIGKKKVLNPMGEILYESCKKSFKELDSSLNLAQKRINDLGDFDIQIAGRRELFRSLLPNDGFSGTVNYLSCTSAEAVNKLLQNEVDFAISTKKPDSLEVVYKRFLKERLHFLIPKKFSKKRPSLKKLSSEELFSSMPIISYNKSLPYITDWIKKNKINESSLNIKSNIDDWDQVVKMVERGLGFTICPSSFVSNESKVYKIDIPTEIISTIELYLLQKIDTKKVLIPESIFHLK